jgi:hypothetical protein
LHRAVTHGDVARQARQTGSARPAAPATAAGSP